MVKNIKNTVWVGLEYFCNENDEFWNMSKNKRVEFVVSELVSMGILDKKDVLI